MQNSLKIAPFCPKLHTKHLQPIPSKPTCFDFPFPAPHSPLFSDPRDSPHWMHYFLLLSRTHKSTHSVAARAVWQLQGLLGYRLFFAHTTTAFFDATLLLSGVGVAPHAVSARRQWRAGSVSLWVFFLFFVEGYYDREGLDQLTGSSSRMTLAFFLLTFSRDSMSAPGALIGTVHAHECCVTLARAR